MSILGIFLFSYLPFARLILMKVTDFFILSTVFLTISLFCKNSLFSSSQKIHDKKESLSLLINELFHHLSQILIKNKYLLKKPSWSLPVAFYTKAWLRCGTGRVKYRKGQKFSGCSAPGVQSMGKVNIIDMDLWAVGKNTKTN